MALAAVALVGLTACGDDDSPAKGAKSGSAARTTTTTAVPGTADASAFEGLTKADAIAEAEAQNRPWRISREDDEEFPVTLDFNENRVTFEIDDGTVTTATFG